MRSAWSLATSTTITENPMTGDRMALMEALQQAGDGNFRCSLAATVLQILMETDVAGLIGACRDERNGERATWRNGGHVRQAGGN